MNITALLLNKNADVNAKVYHMSSSSFLIKFFLMCVFLKDDEGQTALHYAAVCERTAIAELLVKHGADIEVKDNEGNAPRDLCESGWPGLKLISKTAD